MDQNKFFTNFLYEIKQVIVIALVLLTPNSFAVTEITIEPVPPPQKTKPKINAHMVVVFACLLTAISLICLLFFYFRHYAERQLALAARTTGYSEQATMKLDTAHGLDPAVIAEFTSFTYSMVKDIKIGQQVLECAVCLNEFHDHEALRLLPECSHVFHRDCIDKWLAIHVTCPVCRASLVPKPGQLSQQTESPGDWNRPTKDHVLVEILTLKHDLAPPRKLNRSCSMGHRIVDRTKENVERYTLRLPDEIQSVFKNRVFTNRTDVSLLQESSLKTSLRSASANFVRGSDYFDYERFGQERRSGGRNFGITNSFISRSGSGSDTGNDGKDLSSTSKRFLSSVISASNLFQISNKDNDMNMRLNDCSS